MLPCADGARPTRKGEIDGRINRFKKARVEASLKFRNAPADGGNGHAELPSSQRAEIAGSTPSAKNRDRPLQRPRSFSQIRQPSFSKPSIPPIPSLIYDEKRS
jgi:hypothetical protein